MAQSRQVLKNRIRSVESTTKITRVMQLIASTELTKQRKAMERNADYAKGFEKALQTALHSASDQSWVFQQTEGKPSLVFVMVSDMGLCGSYNANVFRQIQSHLSQDDWLIMVGSRGKAWAAAHDYTVDTLLENLNLDTAYHDLSLQIEKAMVLFKKGEVKDVKILYTHYKNTLTYETKIETILPMERSQEETKMSALTEFEPKESELLELMVPLALKSICYARYLESKTCEQASRRMAMEAATDNANELHDELMLAYNQARQSAITNEIIDIVGGANALT